MSTESGLVGVKRCASLQDIGKHHPKV